MSNEHHEKRLEKTSPAGDQQVAGKPILNSEENATQQRLEKQTAARAHRFTKGDNVFQIDLGDGNTVKDSRKQTSDRHSPIQTNDNLLLAQNAPEQGAALSGEISTDVNQVVAPGHSVKFTEGKGGRIQYEASGHWDAAQWNQQIAALNDFFTAHPEAVNSLVAEVRKHKGSLTLSGGAEVGNDSHVTTPTQTGVHENSESHTLNDKRKPDDHSPLSGEISNDLDARILHGHAVEFSLRPGGGVNWKPIGHWSRAEWQAQDAKFREYFAPPNQARMDALIAEIKENRGPIKLGTEVSEPNPMPPSPSPEGTDRFQWLAGSGYINGRQVQMGGPNDVKIPASAGANTPVVLSTMDGSGETIHGHIVVNGNGQKFFYPDYSEDQQHRRYQIQNARQNMIQLTKAGAATY